jgi:uncharacterized phage infection (PIP) family protein YhgE
MLVLDFLLLIMTIVCVVYCWMLNKRIQDLQNSRIEFARMIKELNASIVKAENNVNEMSELSKVTSNEIKSVVEEANDISSELATMSEIASELSARLSSQTQSIGKSLYEFESPQNSYENSMNSKPKEKFTEDDLAPIVDDASESKYTNQLKNFIQSIVSKKTEEQNPSLNQMNYYETLRKINAKK